MLAAVSISAAVKHLGFMVEQSIYSANYLDAKYHCITAIEKMQNKQIDSSTPWFLEHSYVKTGDNGSQSISEMENGDDELDPTHEDIIFQLLRLPPNKSDAISTDIFNAHYRNTNIFLKWRIGSPDIQKATAIVKCKYDIFAKLAHAAMTPTGFETCIKFAREASAKSSCYETYRSFERERMSGPD